MYLPVVVGLGDFVISAATEALDMAARDLAALPPAAVVVAAALPGEECNRELLMAPTDIEPVAVIEAKQEGAGVLSAL